MKIKYWNRLKNVKENNRPSSPMYETCDNSGIVESARNKGGAT
jgi:hypothetical protein